MTREEAHNYMWYENDKNPRIRWGHHNTINNLHKTLIDKIYDDFETELKTKQEAINYLSAELLTLKADEAARYKVKDNK